MKRHRPPPAAAIQLGIAKLTPAPAGCSCLPPNDADTLKACTESLTYAKMPNGSQSDFTDWNKAILEFWEKKCGEALQILLQPMFLKRNMYRFADKNVCKGNCRPPEPQSSLLPGATWPGQALLLCVTQRCVLASIINAESLPILCSASHRVAPGLTWNTQVRGNPSELFQQVAYSSALATWEPGTDSALGMRHIRVLLSPLIGDLVHDVLLHIAQCIVDALHALQAAVCAIHVGSRRRLRSRRLARLWSHVMQHRLHNQNNCQSASTAE